MPSGLRFAAFIGLHKFSLGTKNEKLLSYAFFQFLISVVSPRDCDSLTQVGGLYVLFKRPFIKAGPFLTLVWRKDCR